MRFLYCAIFVFLFMSVPSKAQLDEEPEKAKDELSLNIRLVNFIRNNEYFNPIGGSGFNLTGELPLHEEKSLWIEGYTLTGFLFRPELVYNPSEKISLNGGIHLLKYWGAGGFSDIRPVFSASLKLTGKTVLTLGSLSGSNTHRMYDPHFDKERFYTDFAEEGLQIRTMGERVFNDAWVSWENFILKGDLEREIFTFGESFRYTSPAIFEYLGIEVPVQLQFKHFGGQISDYPERVTTFFNLAAGLRANIHTGKFGSVGLEYTRFINSVIPDRDTYSISNGNADWLRFYYDLKQFSFMASYWHADDFYAPNGNPLFASVFLFDSDYVIHERKLCTGSASIRLLPEEYFELYFGAEVYYDICARRLDHALTLHLDFGRMFRLK